jgi:glutathione synthase/RimK-type ligase-like ATP-grasp enzyme
MESLKAILEKTNNYFTTTMKIAILTCDQLPNLNLADQPLIKELAKHNIVASPMVWDDPNTNWSDFDYLIFRNTWDYFEKEIQFNLWLNKIEQLGIKTLNSIAVIKQNKHKFYLREMEKQGVRILKTIFIDKTDKLNIQDLIPSYWKRAVIKPAFSAGSYLTEVFESVNSNHINTKYQTIAAEKELLLQEFMPEIQTLGETSFIFFNKKFSHAVNKKPAEGDFRIQVQFGGQYTLINPDKELIEQAQKVVDLFNENLLYARVDGIIINNQLHLMEVECIEPDLYLNLSDGALERFSNSIIEQTQK